MKLSKSVPTITALAFLLSAPAAFAQTTPAGADNGMKAKQDSTEKTMSGRSDSMKAGGDMKPTTSGSSSPQGSSTPAGPAADTEKK